MAQAPIPEYEMNWPSDRSEALAAWNRDVAEIVAAADHETQLPRALLHAMRALTPADLGYVMLHDRSGGGLQLLYLDPEDFEPAPRYPDELLYAAYENGTTGVMTLRDAMPTGFERTFHYHQRFVKSGYEDELIHVVELPGGKILRVGLGRASSLGHFTPEEVSQQEAAHPVIRAFALRLAALVSETAPLRPETTGLEEALHHFGEEVLTKREQEVVHLVLQGHNTESVASELEIAFNTVRRHRCRAYAKLRVSSQGELFYKFLESIGLSSKPLATLQALPA